MDYHSVLPWNYPASVSSFVLELRLSCPAHFTPEDGRIGDEGEGRYIHKTFVYSWNGERATVVAFEEIESYQSKFIVV